jgi:opacity protein-like surface antigen
MKKVQIAGLSLLLVGGLLSNQLAAQDEKVGGFYVDVNLGYGFSAGSETFGSTVSSTYSNARDNTTENTVTGSLGNGMRFGGNVGYQFNANIGVELGINYLLGRTFYVDQSYTYTSSLNGEEFFWSYGKDWSASMLQFNPSIVLSTGNKRIRPYVKFGIIIGAAAKITTFEYEYEPSYSLNPTYVIDEHFAEYELSGGIALGWSAALGAKYAFNDKISLFGELNLINLSYAPTKGVMTLDMQNGVNNLPGATTREKEVEFLNEITTFINESTPDENQPSQELKEYYSFSSVGIQVGLHIAF